MDAQIEITELIFQKSGLLIYEGTVDNCFVKGSLDVSCKEFEKILPVEAAEYEFQDEDGLCNAVMDQYQNIHWLILIGGNILNRVVRLTTIVEELLYESYINNQ